MRSPHNLPTPQEIATARTARLRLPEAYRAIVQAEIAAAITHDRRQVNDWLQVQIGGLREAIASLLYPKG